MRSQKAEPKQSGIVMRVKRNKESKAYQEYQCKHFINIVKKKLEGKYQTIKHHETQESADVFGSTIKGEVIMYSKEIKFGLRVIRFFFASA